MGMDALVASTEQAYVELAVTLTRDSALHLKLRDEMIARRGLLFADLEPVRALERFLESVARTGAV
jgi:predicted O-linked N-acetylglucosamine transferase (SPINDLY family)